MTLSAPLLSERVEEGVRVWRAGEGRTVVGLAGPPTSALLLRHLARPLVEAGHALVLPELFDPPPPRATLEDLADRVAPLVPEGAVLLSHGLALPVAALVSARTPAVGLVVASGPVERLDPLTRAWARLSRVAPPLARALLGPRTLVPLLASSAGLRRTVTNPYAMDRDIVAMLSAPLIATPAHRAAVVEYLASASAIDGSLHLPEIPVLWIWSSLDGLYPPPDHVSRSAPGAEISVKELEGGGFLSIEERPWDVARAILEWADPLWAR